MHHKFRRVSDRLQVLGIVLQWLCVIRAIILLIGRGETTFAAPYIAATQPLVWIPNAIFHPIVIGPFIAEAGTALLAVALPLLFSLTARGLDYLRLRHKLSLAHS